MNNLSAGNLAYLGDAVFELMVRGHLLKDGSRPLNALNTAAKRYVSAKAQSALYHKIMPRLTADEQALLKRGRNLHSQSRAKNAEVTEYRHATGLETLFGHLYLQGEAARLEEIFSWCVEQRNDY